VVALITIAGVLPPKTVGYGPLNGIGHPHAPSGTLGPIANPRIAVPGGA
jgi:hypothetical protein